MDIGIVGLPRSGKTTMFNAVTRGSVAVADFSGSGKPNVGVAKVPDERLDTLVGIFNPKRRVPAEIKYVDVPPPPEGFGKTRGVSGEYLGHLQLVDVLMVVVRAFEDPAVTGAEDGIDPVRDAELMLLELAFADIELLDRRLARLAESAKGARAQEREGQAKEQALLERLKAGLEAGTPVRKQDYTEDEALTFRGFNLLTDKPAIVVANLGEDELSEAEATEARLSAALDGSQEGVAAICGGLEMELASMSPEDEAEMREAMEVTGSGLDRMIELSYRASDTITFYTAAEIEARAWTIDRGTEAAKAAGGIHSDFERGFIRAEVVAYDDFLECRTYAEARRRGLYRNEGRTYIIKDGDMVNILFNV